MKKNSTQAKSPYEIAAERVMVILNDDETPQFLRDILRDGINGLMNETEANGFHPQIAPLIIGIGLRDADDQGLRICNGQITRDEGSEQ